MRKPEIRFSIPVSILKEGSSFVAYSPVLDLSTVGKTFEDAKRMFNEEAQIFFEEILKKGTADEVLTELGWQRVKKTFSPPVVVSHLTEEFTVAVH